MSAAKPFAHHNIKVRPRSAAPTGGYYADQVAKAYAYPSVSPAGTTIGIVELGGAYYASDLQAFCQARGIPMPTVNVFGTQSPDPGGADVEVMLDVENIAAAFPGCTINLYFGDNSEAGFIAAVQQAVAVSDVVSCSWGAPEDQWSAQGIQQLNAAMAGKPVCVASGDNGSSDGESGKHVDFPASGPNAIACGGTSIPAGSNGLPNISAETSWSDSGGGISAVFAKPSYQAGESLSGSMRGSPDVAALADPNTPYNVFVNGAWLQVGGTSGAAPMVAALFGLLKAQAKTLPADVHPLLYAAGNCRDIIGGSNGAYQAGPGYDLVTGNGVPIPSKLLAALSGTASPPPPPPTSPPSPPSPPPAPTPAPTPDPILQEIDAELTAAISASQKVTAELQALKSWLDTTLGGVLSVINGNPWLSLARQELHRQFTALGGGQSLPLHAKLTALFCIVKANPFLSLAWEAAKEHLRTAVKSRSLPPGTLANILQFLQGLLSAAPTIAQEIEQIIAIFQGGSTGG